MKNAALHLVRYSLSQGHAVSVWDHEDWQVSKSTNYREISESIKSMEEAKVVIYSVQGDKLAWALVSMYGLEPDETIMNCSENEYMQRFDSYLEWQG